MISSYRWPIAVAIGYLVFAAPAPAPAIAEPASLMAYGLGEGITPAQSASVDYLLWPQSYEAIVNLLGYPDYRDSQSDWWRSGDMRLRIDYQGTTAIGHAWEVR